MRCFRLTLISEKSSEAKTYPIRPWPVVVSLALHALLLVALTYLLIVRPVARLPAKIIDVQIINERPSAVSRAMAPAVLATPLPQAANIAPEPVATPRPSLATAAPLPPTLSIQDHPIPATTLYSTGLLEEAASSEVRRTLPTLDPYERKTQLCNIEATEQIRRALPGSNPETVSAAAFSDTLIQDGKLIADGAAYRSHRNWFFMEYTCAVRSDFKGVLSFSYALGSQIPKDQWDSHDLIAIDEDDE